MKPADFNALLQALEGDWQNLLRDRDLLRIPILRPFCAYEIQPTAGITVVSRVCASTRGDANPEARTAVDGALPDTSAGCRPIGSRRCFPGVATE